MSFLFCIQSGAHKHYHHIQYEESECHLPALFAIKHSEADTHTFPFTGSHAVNKKQQNKKKTLYTVGSLTVSASVIKAYCLNRCTVLDRHHNHAFKYHTCFGSTQSQICATEYLHTAGERHSLQKKQTKKTYMLIYYTLKMHLSAAFPPSHPLISLSPAFFHVGGSTGHPAMPHQYAYW